MLRRRLPVVALYRVITTRSMENHTPGTQFTDPCAPLLHTPVMRGSWFKESGIALYLQMGAVSLHECHTYSMYDDGSLGRIRQAREEWSYAWCWYTKKYQSHCRSHSGSSHRASSWIMYGVIPSRMMTWLPWPNPAAR